MDGLWSVPHDAIRAAAARKASVPIWQVGAVRVTSGLYCYVRVIDGPTVLVTERDVLLHDVSIPRQESPR